MDRAPQAGLRLLQATPLRSPGGRTARPPSQPRCLCSLLAAHCPSHLQTLRTVEGLLYSSPATGKEKPQGPRPTANSDHCLNQAPSPVGHVHLGQASSGEESSLTSSPSLIRCLQLHRHPGHPGEDTSHITMSACWHSAVCRACFKPLFHVGVTLFISLGS